MSEFKKMTAGDFCKKAEGLLTERGKEYDPSGKEEERSMQAIVATFNAATKRDLTESEGWAFMQCVKLVRLFGKEGFHQDSAEDNVAYAALLAESKQADRKSPCIAVNPEAWAKHQEKLENLRYTKEVEGVNYHLKDFNACVPCEFTPVTTACIGCSNLGR